MSSGNPVLQQSIKQQYEQIDDLWNSFDDQSKTQGMSGDTVTQLRTHIVTARDALKTATELVGRSV